VIYTSKRSGKVTFVILFNDPNFMWQKYEGACFGSTQNYIYYKDQRMNTKQFIELTDQQVAQNLGFATGT
jgi:hypothetical protein